MAEIEHILETEKFETAGRKSGDCEINTSRKRTHQHCQQASVSHPRGEDFVHPPAVTNMPMAVDLSAPWSSDDIMPQTPEYCHNYQTMSHGLEPCQQPHNQYDAMDHLVNSQFHPSQVPEATMPPQLDLSQHPSQTDLMLPNFDPSQTDFMLPNLDPSQTDLVWPNLDPSHYDPQMVPEDFESFVMMAYPPPLQVPPETDPQSVIYRNVDFGSSGGGENVDDWISLQI